MKKEAGQSINPHDCFKQGMQTWKVIKNKQSTETNWREGVKNICKTNKNTLHPYKQYELY